jgi:hypothetical protein
MSTVTASGKVSVLRNYTNVFNILIALPVGKLFAYFPRVRVAHLISDGVRAVLLGYCGSNTDAKACDISLLQGARTGSWKHLAAYSMGDEEASGGGKADGALSRPLTLSSTDV